VAVPTLILLDGFEWGYNPLTAVTVLGGGIGTSLGNAPGLICDSSVKRSGTYSLKVTQDGANATRLVKSFASTTMLVGSFYYRATTAPAAASLITTASTAIPQLRIETDGKLSALFSGGAAQSTAGSIVDSNWHLIDFKIDVSANPQLFDWKVDGTAQTQATRTVAASTLTTFSLGSSAAGSNHTFWLDDFVLSVTSGDYPLGSTTTPHSVLAVLPTGDGTHNAGTNTIEDNAGTDIASPNAFPLVDNWPPDTAAYIRQATIDTTAYAEVTFANHDAAIGTIWDAYPLVAFTSSTNAVNEGACIVSFDSFSTSTEVYGTPAARTNYQSSTTTNVNFKSKNGTTADGLITRPVGNWTTSAFDALKARIGYSGDVTGNPRWHGLMVQYAGVAGGTTETDFAGMVPI